MLMFSKRSRIIVSAVMKVIFIYIMIFVLYGVVKSNLPFMGKVIVLLMLFSETATIILKPTFITRRYGREAL